MRNWPLFGFLIGLVLFFYAFYIFQAQSGELSLLKETNDRLSIQLDKLRTDDLAHKTDLEKLQTEITNLRKDKDQSDADNRQCSTNLEELKSKVSQLTAERTELTDSQKASEDHVRELTAKLEALQRNATSQEQQLSSQVILVQQLNETVHILRNELDKKQAAAAAPVAVQPPQGSNVEKQVAPVAAGFSRAPLVVAANEGQGGAEIARPLNNLGDLINPQQKKSEGVGNEEAGPKDVEAPMNPLTEQQPAPAAGDSDAAAAAIPAPNQLKDDTAAKEAPVVKDDVLAPGARVRLEEKTENEDKQDGLVAAANEEKKEVAAVPKPAVKDGEYEDADDVDRAGEKEDKEAVKEEEDSPKR